MCHFHSIQSAHWPALSVALSSRRQLGLRRAAAAMGGRHHRRRYGMLSWLSGGGTEQESQLGGAGLPEPKDAQQLQVVRLPRFLSDDEIALILETASDIRRDGAGEVRLQSDQEVVEADGHRGEWSTIYLQTEHMFQARLPELHDRIKRAAIAADRANWGVCAAALAAADEGSDVRTRVIELHTVGPTGGLPAAQHFDSGSCVTIDLMLSEPDAGGAFGTLEAIDGEVRSRLPVRACLPACLHVNASCCMGLRLFCAWLVPVPIILWTPCAPRR
jgi:hypothetical protein